MTGAELALHLAAVRRRRRAARRRLEVLAGGWGRAAQAKALALLVPVSTCDLRIEQVLAEVRAELRLNRQGAT